MAPVPSCSNSRISCRSGSCSVGQARPGFIARAIRLSYLRGMNDLITRGMILAAGLGTRFKPWTDRHPKALAMVNGKSLLQRNIEYLQSFGIRDIVVNVHHFAEQIEEALAINQGWGSRYVISDETAAVLETGGGLRKAAPLLEN